MAEGILSELIGEQGNTQAGRSRQRRCSRGLRVGADQCQDVLAGGKDDTATGYKVCSVQRYSAARKRTASIGCGKSGSGCGTRIDEWDHEERNDGNDEQG